MACGRVLDQQGNLDSVSGAELGTAVQQYGLGGLAAATTHTIGFPASAHLLGQPVAALVLAGYATAAILVGSALMKGRDITT